MKTKLICTVGAMTLGAAALALGGFKDMNAFVEAESQNEIHAGDGSVSFHEPPGPASVTVTPRDGWRFTDGSTSKTIVHNPGETNVIHMASREGEQDKDLTIVDDWRHTHDCARGVAHDHAPEIMAGEADIKPIALYAAPALGTPAVTNIDWETVVKGAHVSSNAMVTVCRFPGCGFKCDPDAEIIEIEPEPLEEACTLVGGVVGKDGVLYLPKGSYDYMLTANWKSETCDECACGSYTNVHVDVYEALLECEEYLGLNMTSIGEQQTRKAEAKTEGPYPDGYFCHEWLTYPHCRICREDENGAGYDPLVLEPSSRCREETIQTTLTLNGCGESVYCTNSFTVVKVDVEIDNQGEDVEETQGAFLYHVPDDKNGEWRAEATNYLKKVVITYEPSDLPENQIISIEIPEKFLYEKVGPDDYEEAKKEYTLCELKKKKFFLHGHERSKSFKDLELKVTHGVSGAIDLARFTVFGRPNLVPDYDRDTKITDEEKNISDDEETTFRFWINDDRDEGDMCNNDDYEYDAPGCGKNWKEEEVPGRNDLEDYTPVWIDLTDVFPVGTPDSIRSSAEFRLVSDCVRVIWTEYQRADAGKFLRSDATVCWHDAKGVAYQAHNAPVSNPDVLPELFLKRVFDNPQKGVILVEGRGPGETLELDVKIGERLLFRRSLKIKVDGVEKMYRWVNLRAVAGDNRQEPLLNDAPPTNRPDEECDEYNYVFVHGFNINPTEARANAAETFKRLWQSGLKSKFTAVDWRGDEGQFHWVNVKFDPRKWNRSTMDANYYKNAINAFITAPALVKACKGLPGKKIMMGHSLGNMLISSAAVDWGLEYEQYYMFNAAVAMEAYDADAFASVMIDPIWRNVDQGSRASQWYKLFEGTNDFRRTLAWKDRFKGIKNAINCYSETEDVVGNLEDGQSFRSKCAWPLQETMKGGFEIHYLNTLLPITEWVWSSVECEGGWGVNTYYKADVRKYVVGSGFREQYRCITNRNDLITHPLFTPFRAETEKMHSLDLFEIKSESDDQYEYKLRARFLCDAIPAESFAMGANKALGVARNVDMMAEGRDNVEFWPSKSRDRKKQVWRHNDMKNVAYFFVYPLYDLAVKR